MLTPFRTRFDDLVTDMMAMDSQMRMPHPTMALDLAETATDYKIKVDMPGIEKENITLDAAKDHQLVIKAERKSEKVEGDDSTHFHRVERTYGAVSRTVRLPETADLNTTTASLKDGVLEITVKKCEPPTRFHRVPIE